LDSRRWRLSDSLRDVRVVAITWAPGGNLPPLLAAASVLERRRHEVTVLASGETSDAARRAGLEVTAYRRSPDPDVRVAFEAQAELMTWSVAGAEIALDVRDVLDELRPDVAVVDCMLPAAIAAARATRTPTAAGRVLGARVAARPDPAPGPRAPRPPARCVRRGVGGAGAPARRRAAHPRTRGRSRHGSVGRGLALERLLDPAAPVGELFEELFVASTLAVAEPNGVGR
jgi:UDP:flavonoid glycosyltransferase YjiC (YdhE family)